MEQDKAKIGIGGVVVLIVLLFVVFGHHGGSSSRPDWCAAVDDATTQLANIGNGAVDGTATMGDVAGWFGQVQDDLTNVSLTASGTPAEEARQGAISAGRQRVAALNGRGPGGEAENLKAQMAALGPRCGD